MIKMMMSKDGALGPVVVCDACGERIMEVRKAVAMYPSRSVEPGQLADVLHVHKGDCDRRASAKHGDAGGTDELGTHLVFLIENTDLRDPKTLAEAKEMADMTRQL